MSAHFNETFINSFLFNSKIHLHFYCFHKKLVVLFEYFTVIINNCVKASVPQDLHSLLPFFHLKLPAATGM